MGLGAAAAGAAGKRFEQSVGPMIPSRGLSKLLLAGHTRASIFAAMQRKETFGTNGPRIQVRLFGGWLRPGRAAAEGLGQDRLR
jgi:hypothetical protein